MEELIRIMDMDSPKRKGPGFSYAKLAFKTLTEGEDNNAGSINFSSKPNPERDNLEKDDKSANKTALT
jgi:hypothetical protein